MKRLEGKVAVVTGGNSGIGLATAQRFLEEGAKVAISGRNQKTLEAAAKLLGDGVLVLQADTASLKETEKFLAAVEKKFGKIDVLFVNAGVAKFAPLTETSEGLFDEQFDINIKGAYFTIQKALPHLNDGASIILNTSVVSSTGVAGASAYSATKAALRSVARTAAAELVGRGIRVNAVAPGPIVTDLFMSANSEATVKRLIESTVVGRGGTPDDVARAILFFLSPQSDFITGQVLHVCGGTSLGASPW